MNNYLSPVCDIGGKLLLGLLVSVGFLAMPADTLCQSGVAKATNRKFRDVPKATEECTPVECDWWKRLRDAANKLQARDSETNRRKYVQLFVEGLERSYRIPLSDRPAHTLVNGPVPAVDGLDASQRNGVVELTAEVRSDASIGDVKITKGLGPEIDRRCIASVRQYLSMPAIKDHKFVTSWIEPKFMFSYPTTKIDHKSRDLTQEAVSRRF